MQSFMNKCVDVFLQVFIVHYVPKTTWAKEIKTMNDTEKTSNSTFIILQYHKNIKFGVPERLNC